MPHALTPDSKHKLLPLKATPTQGNCQVRSHPPVAPTPCLAPHLTAVHVLPEVVPVNHALAIGIKCLESVGNDAELGVREGRWLRTAGVALCLQLGQGLGDGRCVRTRPPQSHTTQGKHHRPHPRAKKHLRPHPTSNHIHKEPHHVGLRYSEATPTRKPHIQAQQRERSTKSLAHQKVTCMMGHIPCIVWNF